VTTAIREALKQGKAVLGSMVALPSPGFVEALGYSGLDFVIIDTEHGPADVEKVEALLRAAQAGGTVPFVRVSAGQRDLISRVMDSGAAGVMVPQINSVPDLDVAVNAIRFPPKGTRGLAPTVRAARYGFLPLAEFLRWSNEDALFISQIESSQAVDNLPGLLGTGKVDVAFIGPMDLSQSLGVPGAIADARVQEAIERTLHIAKEHGVPVGTVAADAAGAIAWARRGCPFIVLSSVTAFRAYHSIVEETRKALGR